MLSNSILFGGHEVSRIGFGCWQLAGDYAVNGKPNGYGAVDPDESIRAIHLALDHGISFFDTAIGYGSGKSEEVLGRALKAHRGSGKTNPVICTKYSISPDNAKDTDDLSEETLVKSVEGSLARLQVDCLGAILLHNPPDDFDFSVFDTTPFEKLVRAGKILSYGVSCRTQKGVANVLRHGFGSVIEAVYNPLDRRYETYFNNPIYEKYTFICRVPLASGFISPRTLAGNPVFGENDIRHNFNSEQVAWVISSVRKLSFLHDLEGGLAVSALRFQLSNSGSTITIPGIKNTKQAGDAIKALEAGPLPEDILQKIAEAVPEVFYKWR